MTVLSLIELSDSSSIEQREILTYKYIICKIVSKYEKNYIKNETRVLLK